MPTAVEAFKPLSTHSWSYSDAEKIHFSSHDCEKVYMLFKMYVLARIFLISQQDCDGFFFRELQTLYSSLDIIHIRITHTESMPCLRSN